MFYFNFAESKQTWIEILHKFSANITRETCQKYNLKIQFEIKMNKLRIQ